MRPHLRMVMHFEFELHGRAETDDLREAYEALTELEEDCLWIKLSRIVLTPVEDDDAAV